MISLIIIQVPKQHAKGSFLPTKRWNTSWMMSAAMEMRIACLNVHTLTKRNTTAEIEKELE